MFCDIARILLRKVCVSNIKQPSTWASVPQKLFENRKSHDYIPAGVSQNSDLQILLHTGCVKEMNPRVARVQPRLRLRRKCCKRLYDIYLQITLDENGVWKVAALRRCAILAQRLLTVAKEPPRVRISFDETFPHNNLNEFT